MKTPIASPRARTLAAALREARESRGVGLRELSRLLAVPHPLLCYWEKGTRLPTPEDVAHLLGCLQISGEPKDQIIDLARDTHVANWLATEPSDIPHTLTGVNACEQSAVCITMWSPTIIPGLLQTPDYARAMLNAVGIPLHQADTRLQIRLERQRILRKRNPPSLSAVISEVALHQTIGEAGVMSDQLDYLLAASRRDNVSIRMLPSGLEWHPGLIGPFAIYEFERLPPIVFLEHYRSAAFLYEDDHVRAYLGTAKMMVERALGEEDSQQLIAEAID